jgi:hypothetical protein
VPVVHRDGGAAHSVKADLVALERGARRVIETLSTDGGACIMKFP